MDHREHWNAAWSSGNAETVSWYQEQPEPSLRLVCAVTHPNEPVLDVGGGASGLAGALVARGYTMITVVELSRAALEALGSRLGDRASRVAAIEADVLECELVQASVATWHDRAVFHFLTDPADRDRYRFRLNSAVRPGGHVVIGTFALDGPLKCSGLPVERYDAAALMHELGGNWQLVDSLRHEHYTPSGVLQPFTFVVARRIVSE
jgi:hypothetical protein